MLNPFIKYMLFVLVSSCIFCLDQVTKTLIQTQVFLEQPITVIEGFFNINYVQNTGGAFGLFSESHEWIRFVLFIFFPIVAFVFIFMMLRETQQKLQIFALGFILGGALGNYMDRLRLGYVVDFIDWHIKDWHWPTFNIADSFIVIGVFILLIFFKQEKQVSS